MDRPRSQPGKAAGGQMNSNTFARLMRLRITTAPALSTPCIWKTDFAISRPIVLTSPMDGSPQCGLLKATTLGHFDAAEWAPSTASKADMCIALAYVRFTPESGIPPRTTFYWSPPIIALIGSYARPQSQQHLLLLSAAPSTFMDRSIRYHR